MIPLVGMNDGEGSGLKINVEYYFTGSWSLRDAVFQKDLISKQPCILYYFAVDVIGKKELKT